MEVPRRPARRAAPTFARRVGVSRAGPLPPEGDVPIMPNGTATPETPPRPSRVIAEALVQRHGPHRIANRAARLGLSPQLTRAMVTACGQTAVDPSAAGHRAVPSAA